MVPTGPGLDQYQRSRGTVLPRVTRGAGLRLILNMITS